MLTRSIETVEGTITLTDGSTSTFIIRADGGWTQWDAPTERLGATVYAVTDMADALTRNDHLTPED